MENQYSYNHT